MITPKGKEIEKRRELPKIIVTKPPTAAIKRIPKKIAKEAMTRTEMNATKVAQGFVNHFTISLNKTPEGRQFLINMKKNSEIGNVLFV